MRMRMLALVLVLLVLAGCTGSLPVPEPTAAPEPTAEPPAAVEPSPAPTDAADAEDPTSAGGEVEALVNQASAQISAADWEGAEATLRQLLEIEGEETRAHSGLAYIFVQQGRLDDAIAETMEIIEIEPDFISFANLAVLYQQKGDIEKAIAAAEESLELAPEEAKGQVQGLLAQLSQPTPLPPATLAPDQKAGDLEPAQRDGVYDEPPPMVIDPDKSYTAIIETEGGDIEIELYADKVPNTVNNFVFLAREGFYDNTTFHRVIPEFMAQAGDPTGTGRGGPGYRFDDEFDPDLRHDGPGILSMANSGPNTNGSQFFITLAPTPHLDDVHSIFGKVLKGAEVLTAITPRDPGTASEPGDLIKTIRIEEE